VAGHEILRRNRDPRSAWRVIWRKHSVDHLERDVLVARASSNVRSPPEQF
jgi:hypothetical protein